MNEARLLGLTEVARPFMAGEIDEGGRLVLANGPAWAVQNPAFPTPNAKEET
ncbi:hypothetical protein GCM10011378_35360 [Hymenobacter glacieicola]|uniref:Uncharacterized protein n=1 Tax=Hymenobacter glacieicola TaxID=1562124 RepID=A0ABQ1X3U4_9BACT|nr:hypothetical protein GCM10011378_35360 [Hymenobacter glacieicola]